MQPFIAPLSSNRCVPPARAAASGAPGSASQRHWPELASAGRAGVLPSQFKIIDPSAPVSGERLSDDDSSQKQKRARSNIENRPPYPINAFTNSRSC